jgi:hypothetical protein
MGNNIICSMHYFFLENDAEVGLDRNCMFYSFTCQLSGVLPRERLAPFVTLAVIISS